MWGVSGGSKGAEEPPGSDGQGCASALDLLEVRQEVFGVRSRCLSLLVRLAQTCVSYRHERS